MATEINLTMEPSYASTWSVVDAVREFFQNALDNEIVNPENKMLFSYDKEAKKLFIGNKTSCLERHTLLLGSTTKADNENTIGQHGEGYKIGIAILLRNNKHVTIYNYQKKEIWTTRLKKSKTFDGRLIPCITITKTPIWEKVPSHDLMIEISEINEEEYEQIKESNLHLKSYNSINTSYGEILTDESEKQRVYVKGLYVCSCDGLNFGYNFEPDQISLDRDRKLIREYDLYAKTSAIWKKVYAMKALGEYKQAFFDMLNNRADEIRDIYYTVVSTEDMDNKDIENKLGSELVERFIDENGENSTPVTTSDQIEEAHSNGLKAVLVSDSVYRLMKDCDKVSEVIVEKAPLKVRMTEFMDKIESKLTDEELAEFSSLIDEI